VAGQYAGQNRNITISRSEAERKARKASVEDVIGSNKYWRRNIRDLIAASLGGTAEATNLPDAQIAATAAQPPIPRTDKEEFLLKAAADYKAQAAKLQQEAQETRETASAEAEALKAATKAQKELVAAKKELAKAKAGANKK
jgi:hypothetical protein